MSISYHTTKSGLKFAIDTNDWYHEKDSDLAEATLCDLLDLADQDKLAASHAAALDDPDENQEFLDDLGNQALAMVIENQKYASYPQTGHNCIAIPVED